MVRSRCCFCARFVRLSPIRRSARDVYRATGGAQWIRIGSQASRRPRTSVTSRPVSVSSDLTAAPPEHPPPAECLRQLHALPRDSLSRSRAVAPEPPPRRQPQRRRRARQRPNRQG